MSILAIEIGTIGCAAIVYARDGGVLARAAQEYALRHPVPGAMELDANEVMARVGEAIVDAVQTAGEKIPVRAMSIATQGETIVPVDEFGIPLAPALTTFDARPAEEMRWWEETVGSERIQRITGLTLHPMYSLLKMGWWRTHRPDLLQAARWWVNFDALFLLRCGMEPVTDYSLGGRTMAMDLEKKTWSRELVNGAGLSIDHLPRLVQAGTPLGILPRRAAGQYHLPSDVQVVAGGHDQACGALGCGVIEPGMAMNGIGLAENLLPVLDAPVFTPGMRDGHYGCFPHVVPNRYLALAFHFSAESLVRWFHVTLGEEEEAEAEASGLHVLEILLNKAGSAPSAVLMLPHFATAGTPWLDPDARGAIVGLTLRSPKSHIIKGLLDGITYETRLNLIRLEEAGAPIHALRVVGMGADSVHWLQLRANILNRPIVGVTMPDPACLGAALLAGIGAGQYRDAQAAVAQTVHAGHHVDPQPEQVEKYHAPFKQYRQLYEALRPIFHGM